jgi:hypothetical protein
MKKHGMSQTRTYRIWAGMIQRCTNQNVKAYPHYGGRGITVCPQWLTFDNFYRDMGECPPGYSIEREGNDGNYEPGNCKWLPLTEQSKNRRSVRRIPFNGEELISREVAERSSLKLATVKYRVSHGVPLDKPVGRDVILEFSGRRMNLQDWARHLGLAKSTLTMRMKRGLPIERVLHA